MDFPNVGDFVNFDKNFGDIFFEVLSVSRPQPGSTYWSITYAKYAKYSAVMETRWENSASAKVRRVIPEENAVQTMIDQRLRFYSTLGRYDPFTGFIARTK